MVSILSVMTLSLMTLRNVNQSIMGGGGRLGAPYKAIMQVGGNRRLRCGMCCARDHRHPRKGDAGARSYCPGSRRSLGTRLYHWLRKRIRKGLANEFRVDGCALDGSWWSVRGSVAAIQSGPGRRHAWKAAGTHTCRHHCAACIAAASSRSPCQAACYVDGLAEWMLRCCKCITLRRTATFTGRVSTLREAERALVPSSWLQQALQ